MKIGSQIYSCLIVIATAMLLSKCIYIDSVEQPDTVRAGSTLDVIINVRMQPKQDINNTHLILAFLVPKCWYDALKAQITYTSSRGDGYMVKVSDQVLANGSHQNWSSTLSKRYGVGNNSLQEMMWVVYQTINAYNIKANEHLITGKINVQFRVGSQNLRTQLSYFLANDVNGIVHPTTIVFSKPITTIGGVNPFINYLEPQLVSVVPLSGKTKDILTFTFNANAKANNLSKSRVIYLSSVAFTSDHLKIERSTKVQNSRFFPAGNNSWRLNLSPRSFYNLGDKQLQRIEFKLTDIQGNSMGLNNGQTPFIYNFSKS